MRINEHFLGLAQEESELDYGDSLEVHDLYVSEDVNLQIVWWAKPC